MQAFAPGKLVVLGEYAVLDGAPCLALAVRNGVVCNVSHAATRTIRTPDGDDRFVRAALDALPAPAATYAFRDAMPLDLPDKPGLGGSAAAVVAALVAGGCPPDRLLPLALEVHRAVQGSGSGIDVATSATGGAIRFEEGRVTPSSIPAPVVVYSGSSARTGPRVQAYRAWAARQPFVDASAALVDRFPSEPIATVREAWRLLCGMAEAAGVAYRTPGIDRIVAWAEALGGAAKPSGAGGGDIVVAWVPDVPGFVARVATDGFTVLPVEPSGPPTREDPEPT